MREIYKNFYFIIIAILLVSFLLFPFSLTKSGAKYKGETDDFIVQVVDEGAIIFNYTNSEQVAEAPISGYYYISVWGGNGGAGGRGQSGSLSQSPGGVSEEVSGVFYFNKGDKIYIYVGGAGGDAPGGDGTGAGRPGGVNGLGHGNGGSGGNGYKSGIMNGYSGAGGGGGAGTFILTQSGNVNSILLASGGGGGAGGGSGNTTGTASQGGVGGAGGVQRT